MPKQSIYNAEYFIPFRPGQPAWHYRYYRIAKVPVLTLVACRDGFFAYCVKHPKQGKLVSANDCQAFTRLADIWQAMEVLL
jgi:hypothetical protein